MGVSCLELGWSNKRDFLWANLEVGRQETALLSSAKHLHTPRLQVFWGKGSHKEEYTAGLHCLSQAQEVDVVGAHSPGPREVLYHPTGKLLLNGTDPQYAVLLLFLCVWTLMWVYTYTYIHTTYLCRGFLLWGYSYTFWINHLWLNFLQSQYQVIVLRKSAAECQLPSS